MTQVLQVKLYDSGLRAAVRDTIRQCEPALPRQNRCISATGAHGLVMAFKEPDFKRVLEPPTGRRCREREGED